MASTVQLISDGGGLAVIGSAADVEHFLGSEGLPSNPRRTSGCNGSGRSPKQGL